MSARPRRLLGAASGTTHTFSANGYSYTVTIDTEEGGTVATRGEELALNSLKIGAFTVADGWLSIGVTAEPATWLHGFAERLKVRASETLPIPSTDESLLDLSKAELRLEDGEHATILVPLDDENPGKRFFKVEAR